MAAGPISERNQDATIYVGGLDERVSEPLLWELFLQAGPVQSVHMPKDRITQQTQGYGFVEFLNENDADYAIKIMNMIRIFNKPIRVNKPSVHHKNLDVGANLFIRKYFLFSGWCFLPELAQKVYFLLKFFVSFSIS